MKIRFVYNPNIITKKIIIKVELLHCLSLKKWIKTDTVYVFLSPCNYNLYIEKYIYMDL